MAGTAFAQVDRALWDEIRNLGDRHAEVRERAALELAALGADARAAVPYLIAMLRDEQVQVYVAASFALERIGEVALPELSRALREKDTTTRVEVARIVSRLGPRALDAVPALVHALESGDPLVREAMAAALGGVVDDAANALEPELAAAVVAGLVGSLDHRSLDSRETYACAAAATTLGKLGAHAAPAVPALVAQLADEDPRVRTAAAWALGGGYLEPTQTRWMAPRETRAGIGNASGPTVSALTIALDDVDPSVRWSAAQALGGLGAAAAPAIPRLWALVRESVASESLEDGVPQFQPAQVARAAVLSVSVGGILRIPASSGSRVVRRVDGPTGPVDWSRAPSGALRIPVGARAPTPQVSATGPSVRRTLDLHDSVVRLHAAATLCELGEEQAASVLTQVLREDENAAARELAVLLLRRLRPSGTAAALSAARQDGDWQVREAASAALAELGR
jgi:HEAT repeat protein